MNIFDDRAFSDAMRDIRESGSLAAAIPSLEQWSRRVDAVPGLDGCGGCGARVLIDTGTSKARCAGGCGWTGVVLRRLP